MKNKIAVLTQHHDKRADINSLLISLGSTYEITLFSDIKREDEHFKTKTIINNKETK